VRPAPRWTLTPVTAQEQDPQGQRGPAQAAYRLARTEAPARSGLPIASPCSSARPNALTHRWSVGQRHTRLSVWKAILPPWRSRIALLRTASARRRGISASRAFLSKPAIPVHTALLPSSPPVAVLADRLCPHAHTERYTTQPAPSSNTGTALSPPSAHGTRVRQLSLKQHASPQGIASEGMPRPKGMTSGRGPRAFMTSGRGPRAFMTSGRGPRAFMTSGRVYARPTSCFTMAEANSLLTAFLTSTRGAIHQPPAFIDAHATSIRLSSSS